MHKDTTTRDAWIRALSVLGFSHGEIATRVGLTRQRVSQVVAATQAEMDEVVMRTAAHAAAQLIANMVEAYATRAVDEAGLSGPAAWTLLGRAALRLQSAGYPFGEIEKVLRAMSEPPASPLPRWPTPADAT